MDHVSTTKPQKNYSKNPLKARSRNIGVRPWSKKIFFFFDFTPHRICTALLCIRHTHTHAKTAIPRILLSGCGAGKRRKDAPNHVISVPSLATTRMSQRAGSLEMSSDISHFDT